jgi:hypothetical protein
MIPVIIRMAVIIVCVPRVLVAMFGSIAMGRRPRWRTALPLVVFAVAVLMLISFVFVLVSRAIFLEFVLGLTVLAFPFVLLLVAVIRIGYRSMDETD